MYLVLPVKALGARILVRKRVVRTASIIIGLVVVIGSVATGLMILLSGANMPDGVFVEYPYQEHYVSTKPWAPPNGSFGLVFIDAESFKDSVKFRKTTWKNFLELLKTENTSNLYVIRVTCSDFLSCREATAGATMRFYEALVYQFTGGGLAYPPSLIVVYNDNGRIYFVDLIVPKYPGPTEPLGIYDELEEAMSRYKS